MTETKTFRTKTGFCHILPDKIILSRDGIIGNVAELTVGNKISQLLIIYSLFTIVFLYMSFDNYQKGNITQCILLAIFALYLLVNSIMSINNSATPILHRNKIKNIKFKKAITGLSRSRFEVLFEDENGKLKKRLILLPGSIDGGSKETEKALQILKEENLLT